MVGKSLKVLRGNPNSDCVWSGWERGADPRGGCLQVVLPQASSDTPVQASLTPAASHYFSWNKRWKVRVCYLAFSWSWPGYGRWTGPSLGPPALFPVRPYFLALTMIMKPTPCSPAGLVLLHGLCPSFLFPRWPPLLQVRPFQAEGAEL